MARRLRQHAADDEQSKSLRRRRTHSLPRHPHGYTAHRDKLLTYAILQHLADQSSVMR